MTATTTNNAAGLVARGVGYSFDRRAEALTGIDFTAQPGEAVALLGPNGSGKSTLLRLLAGLLAPASGSVTLDGQPLAGFEREALARQLTLVPQESPAPFELSVREVVALGRNPWLGRFTPAGPADHEAVDEALAATDAAHLADRSITELSGGERQRVLIARALAQKTRYLLLDEPTAHLDIEHQLAMLSLVRAQADAGAAVVVAIHDLTLAARFCDRLVLLTATGGAGHVVAQGKPIDVLTPDNIATVFRVRADVLTGPDGGVIAVVPRYATA
jgi:iron complex transport system ATP-binding protein